MTPRVRTVLAGLLAVATAAAGPAFAQGAGQGQKKAPPKSELPPLQDQATGSGSAVEGDIVSVDGAIVRLWGIDAPDPGQMCKTRRSQDYDCYKISRETLNALIGDNQVACKIKAKESTGILTGVCTVRGIDLGGAMVARGWAVAYRQLTPLYAQLEANAQSRQRGMWGGRVEYPWNWRTRQLANKPMPPARKAGGTQKP